MISGFLTNEAENAMLLPKSCYLTLSLELHQKFRFSVLSTYSVLRAVFVVLVNLWDFERYIKIVLIRLVVIDGIEA